MKRFSQHILNKIISSVSIWLLSILLLCVNFPQTNALLWEDLGLDMYKKIDEGLEKLEKKQYEYELSGQWEAPIWDVIGPILASRWLVCDIRTTEDMETILWNTQESSVGFIVERCNTTQEWGTQTNLVAQVQKAIAYTKSSFLVRAQEKTQASYDIGRIGLYSDGNIENSPFDLIFDIQEIDRVIFSEEIEYNGVEQDSSSDKKLDDFMKEDKSYLYQDDVPLDDGDFTGLPDANTWNTWESPVILLPQIRDHQYMCPVNNSWFIQADFEELYNSINWIGGASYVSSTNTWVYPDGSLSNGTSWGGPFPGPGPEWNYTQVRDDWPCGPDEIICIIIEMQKSTYWLAWGTTSSIEKILTKVAEYLEKPANASLTQRKMTTNNFELGSIISNLPWMLRGFWIEVSTKPLPILDLESENEWLLAWSKEIVSNKICKYYKNAGLDCKRKNDVDVFEWSEFEQKILITSAWMPTNSVEVRNNERLKFQDALKDRNRTLYAESNRALLSDNMKKFEKQFSELELFLSSFQDFCNSLAWIVWEMKKIPTRSS